MGEMCLTDFFKLDLYYEKCLASYPICYKFFAC